MENFATILALISMIGLTIGIIGTIKGKVKFLKINSKKHSIYLLIASLVVFMIAGAMMPSSESNDNALANQLIESDIVETQNEVPKDESKQTGNDAQKFGKQDKPTNDNEPVANITDKAEDDTSKDNPTDTSSNNDIATTVTAKQSNGVLTVHYIDVGQGQSQLIIGSTGRVMLIDAGDNNKEKLMVEYLKKEKIEKIDILIGTHPHADHIGGLDAVINNFDIGMIYMPKFQSNTKTFEDVLLAIQNKGLKVSTAKAGLTLDIEEDTIVKMIAPVNDYSDANEMSAVVHLTFGDTSFLFTGDAEGKSEADMINSGENLKADVLLIGHHGSSTSTTKAFLDKVNPSYAVIQSGKGNSYGHPTDEVLNRLIDKNIKIYRNDEQGNIIFTSDGKDITVNTNDWQPSKQVEPTETSKPVEQPQEPEPVKDKVNDELTVTTSISDSKPKQNSSVTVTVSVKDSNGNPVSGATVDLSLKYKSTTTKYDGVTNADGTAVIDFKIGRAAKDYTVNGDITVSYNDVKVKSKTSFTPQ